MKFPVLLWFALVCLGAGLVALGFFVFRDALQPPPIVFNSLAVEDVTPYSANVVASVTREPLPQGCTNNFQADVRSNGDVPDRLPVPLRTQDSAGRSHYALVLPNLVGQHEIQVRETFFCAGRLRVIETPWVRMDIPDAG